MTQIAYLIPAFQPSGRLIELVEVLSKRADGPIVVVNDGSSADGAPIFARLRQIPNVAVLEHAINLGKGAAIKHGINHLLVTYPDIKGIVTADADGQHAVDDILRVAEALRRNPKALVLGAREFGPQTPLRSKFGNSISKVVYRFLLGLKLQDTQTGLRGLPVDLARHSLAIRSNRYEFETEQLALSASLGVPIEEVPIKTIYENNNASSHFNPLLDSARIYFVVFRYALSSMVTSLVDLVVFIGLIAMSLNVIAATLGSRTMSLIVQFALLRSFVFHTQAGVIRFVLFVGYTMLMGLISGALQIQFAGVTGLNVVASKIIVEVVIFVFNFLFLRDLLFSREWDRLPAD